MRKDNLVTNQTRKESASVDFPKEKLKAELPFVIFCSFLCTFVFSRIVVSGINQGWFKLGGYLYVGGVHVHHLNYGIFLLSIVGFVSLTSLGRGWQRTLAIFYGLAVGLIFDEFGRWLKLQDQYYSPLSYDAVIIIAAILALIVSYGAYADRKEKIRASRTQKIPKGTVFLHEGEPGDTAYFIIEGEAEVFRDENDRRYTMAHLVSGDFIGEMALFTEQGRSASVKALTDLKLKPLTKENLFYNLEQHPELGVTLINLLTDRLVIANNRLSAIQHAVYEV